MNAPHPPLTQTPIPDTQSEPDVRHLPIQQVGVRALRYPFRLALAGHAVTTVGTWSLDVALDAEHKGTHMSRFVAWLEDLDTSGTVLDPAALDACLAAMLERLHAGQGRIEVRFTFFLRKTAPVSGVASQLDYEGALVAARRAGVTQVWREVTVPVKTLCPCSKEISDYGAHNQRSHVTIRVLEKQPVEWAELVRFAEDSASCELWGLLKRADEKWVTERAYENPRFVEDLVREVALRLDGDPRIQAFRVTVENFESIHNHSAFAVIEHGL